MKKWLNFKTFFRLGVLVYWGAALFISKWLLVFLVLYAIVRGVFLLGELRVYDEWKMVRYGKSDKRFTVRKLMYILQTAKKHAIHNAYVKTDYESNFDRGTINIDEHLMVKMKSDVFMYETELFFKGKRIAKFKGFSFQQVKWALDDMPELKKIVVKFVEKVEDDFAQVHKQNQKRKEKELKAQKEYEAEARKKLAKEVRETYKKDLSI